MSRPLLWLSGLALVAVTVAALRMAEPAPAPQATEPAAAAQAIDPGSVLEAYDPDGDAVTRHGLPRGLEEVSGLATDAEGRLFAHDDERARIWQIDPLTGEPLKSFLVGPRTLRGDFEGMAVLGERFFLIASDGTLLEFREGADGASVPYRATRTRVRGACEVEGLAADATAGRLLLACKEPVGALRGRVLVYELPADSLDMEPRPRVSLPFDALRPMGLDGLHPSGVEMAPGGGALVLVAAQEGVLLEISAEGRAVAVRSLRPSRHPQPEGIAFDAAGALLLSDEAGDGGPRLTRVPRKPPSEPPPAGP